MTSSPSSVKKTIALAADHAGYELKEALADHVKNLGYNILDLGTDSTAAVDYPDFAEKIALAIREQKAWRGILICGSGVGACVAVNKIPGIRGAICHDSYSAHQGVEHDDMNVLVLGARVLGASLAQELAACFLAARFTHEERHERRLGKIRAIETRYRAS